MDVTEKTKNVTPRSSNIYAISNVCDSNLSIGKGPVLVEQGNPIEEQEDPRNIIIPIYKRYKIRIFKPLFPLKLALFVWFGAGSAIHIFLTVFYSQRGITVAELSTTFIIAPAVQFFGPTLCGVIADKFGRSKPVLVVNLLLTLLIAVGMVTAPSLNTMSCDPQAVKLKCHSQEFGRLIAKTSCDVHTDAIALSSCNVTCPDNVTQHCDGQNLICEMLEGNEDFDNFSLSVHVSWAYKLKNKCYYNVTSMSYKNLTHSWCNVPHKMYCRIRCQMSAEEDCSEVNTSRTTVLLVNASLLILFSTVFSNTYRILDVTSMFLVKEYNSDFGRERFFAIAGQLVFSAVAGYIVEKTTTDDANKNYDSAMYFFIVMAFILLLVISKLDVKIRPPGRNMWRKSLHLSKKPDVIAFMLVLFVLGAAFGFKINFLNLYLERMNARSFLLGLIGSVSALYALPFLLTSNWWVKKIGTAQLFILGLLGYVACGIGYSLMYNPWLCILTEVTNIFNYQLLWVAVVVHSHSIAPEGLTATVISAAGGIHQGIGRGTGGLVGGLIMNAFGGRIAFRVVALICLGTAVLYAIYLYIRIMCFTETQTLDLRNGTVENAPKVDEPAKASITMKHLS